MTYFADLTYDEMLSEIHAAYPDDRAEVLLADGEFVAGLTRGTLLDREAGSEAEVTAYASALVDADDGAFFAAAVAARRLYAEMATMLAAPCATADAADDYDADGHGGLYIAPNAWPIGDESASFDLGALSTALYEDGPR